MTSEHAEPELDERSEFADYEGDVLPFDPQFAWSRLVNPPALRGFAALVGGLFFVFSDRSTEALALILGLVAIGWAAAELIGPGPRRLGAQGINAAVLLGVGVAVLVWPEITGRILSRLLGGAIMFYGLRDVVRAIRQGERDGHQTWVIIRGVFMATVGLSLWVAPLVMLNIVIAVFAMFWVVTGVATAVGNLTGPSEVDVSEVWVRIFTWLDQRPHTADDRSQLYAKLFFEGPLVTRRLSRFLLLMGFATTIAAYGIVSDSTAVVIGAMLVAPLMTPLMGTSLSLIMGWPKRVSMSGLVALGGILLAIGLSVVYGATLPFELDPETNSQIASRIAPTTVDLVIAIAAGGAGAFALSRPDVSDALPGVAVAIALVPPLAVVGLMLQAGYADDAFGALLLFTTNLVAILLVGALVFLLTGVVPIRKIVAEREWIRSTVTLVGILALFVVVVLGTTSERLRAQAFDLDNVEREVDDWIGDRLLRTLDVSVSPDEAEIVVVGPDRPDDVDDLAEALAEDLGRDLVVTVRWVPEEQFVSGGS